MKKFGKKSLEIKDFEVAKIEDCQHESIKGCFMAGCPKSAHCLEFAFIEGPDGIHTCG